MQYQLPLTQNHPVSLVLSLSTRAIGLVPTQAFKGFHDVVTDMTATYDKKGVTIRKGDDTESHNLREGIHYQQFPLLLAYLQSFNLELPKGNMYGL